MGVMELFNRPSSPSFVSGSVAFDVNDFVEVIPHEPFVEMEGREQPSFLLSFQGADTAIPSLRQLLSSY